MRRREFITLLSSTTVIWPIATWAQQRGQVARIGVLMSAAANDPEGQARITAFRQALQKLGWTEGQNVRIEVRWAGGEAALDRKFATELAALTPDVILATASQTVAALQAVTQTVPIVFAHAVDPVGAGFVDSLARPGGNATGFVLFEYGMGAKWLELLKEIAPNVTRVAVLRDPAMAAGIGQFGAIQSVAPSLGVELTAVNVRDPGEIERAISAFARSSNGGLIVTAAPLAIALSHVGRPAQTLRHLQSTFIRHSRRPDLLWNRYPRSIPAGRRLHRSSLKRREAIRLTSTSTNKVRDRNQYEDRQSAGHHNAGFPSYPR